MSSAESAVCNTAPPRQRHAWYSRCQWRSGPAGSWPTRCGAYSWIAFSTDSIAPCSDASPQPTRPSSVVTRTNIQLHQSTQYLKVSMRTIFMKYETFQKMIRYAGPVDCARSA